jgi:hypothetical protein
MMPHAFHQAAAKAHDDNPALVVALCVAAVVAYLLMAIPSVQRC